MFNIFEELDLSKPRKSQQITKIWLSFLIVFQLILGANQGTLIQAKCQPRYLYGKTPITRAKTKVPIAKAKAKLLDL